MVFARLFLGPVLIAYYLIMAIFFTIFVGLLWIFIGQGYVKVVWPYMK